MGYLQSGLNLATLSYICFSFSPIGTRPPSPKSDTEVDHQKEAMSQTALTGDNMSVIDDFKWEWGEIPQCSSQLSQAETALEKKNAGAGWSLCDL